MSEKSTIVIPVPAAPVKVGFVSLGCPKNLVDSEVMTGLLVQAGAELTPAAEDADVIVVNTCSFIASAQQESVDAILEMAPDTTSTEWLAQLRREKRYLTPFLFHLTFSPPAPVNGVHLYESLCSSHDQPRCPGPSAVRGVAYLVAVPEERT